MTTLVAFSYLFNPVQTHVRSLLESGKLGEVISFRGTFDQDLFVEPSEPFNWRMDRAVAGPGALADLGAHVIALALRLVGPLDVVSSMMRTLVPSRQVSIGSPVSRAVEKRTRRIYWPLRRWGDLCGRGQQSGDRTQGRPLLRDPVHSGERHLHARTDQRVWSVSAR